MSVATSLGSAWYLAMRSATLDSSIAGAPLDAWAACEGPGSAAAEPPMALPPRAIARTAASPIVPMATFFQGLDGALGVAVTVDAAAAGAAEAFGAAAFGVDGPLSSWALGVTEA